MSRPKLILLSMFVLVLLAGWSPVFADDAGNPAPAAIPAVSAASACQPVLNLAVDDNVCRAPSLTAPVGQVPEPEFMLAKRRGYCHCGCGPATCHTSDDCGGASCDPFPSCC